MGKFENKTIKEAGPVLVTGATGYVGGRLVPRLLAAGFRVRAMGRSLEKLGCRPWARHPRIEQVRGDVLDPASLYRAAAGCSAAVYLVHAMIARKKAFADADRRSALNMAAAAAAAKLQRVVYLGGLGEVNHAFLSRHLASRHQVGDILHAGPVPATVLRAAMILGSGSASFEILRYLAERLPVMITPRWVHTPSQPIAVKDVLGYLAGCLEAPATAGKTFDIGGPDVLSYCDLIRIFAEEAGLPRRFVLPVPVLTPRLSARWIHLVTPVPAAIAMPLTEGLGVPTICTENRIRKILPRNLTPCRTAIRRALDRIIEDQVETCWSDAGPLNPPEWAVCGDAGYAGGTIFECGYRVTLETRPKAVWPPVIGIGGSNGYYFGNRLWRLRGLLDRMAGGTGLGRGRRQQKALKVGDALDFWRVLRMAPHRRLTLLAEMKMPGQAVLDIRITPEGKNRTELSLLSRFHPRGLAGIAYWYALYPFHQWIFSGMLKAMATRIRALTVSGPERFTPALAPACTLPAGPPEAP